jgi:hypothetical protein
VSHVKRAHFIARPKLVKRPVRAGKTTVKLT